MTSVSFAVHADTIIPVSGTQSALKNYSIVVQEGLIKQLMPSTDARQLKGLGACGAARVMSSCRALSMRMGTPR
jgi:hypothetical protein